MLEYAIYKISSLIVNHLTICKTIKEENVKVPCAYSRKHVL